MTVVPDVERLFEKLKVDLCDIFPAIGGEVVEESLCRMHLTRIEGWRCS